MDLIGGSVASTSQVIDKLVSLLTGEAKLLNGVEVSEVEGLRADLELLMTFLTDAEAKSEAEEYYLSDSVKDWLKQTKDVAELIEDVVDEYVLKVSQKHNQSGFVSFLGKAGRLIGAMNTRDDISSNLQSIKALLLEIKEKGQQSDLIGEASYRRTRFDWFRDRHSMPDLFEGNDVGIDYTAIVLVQRLTGGEAERSVVSLVGSGGIGKTKLAKKV